MAKKKKDNEVSKALRQFAARTRRASEMTNLYIELHKQDQIRMKHSLDIIRSAVVLHVAAMDSYFTERFCDIAVPIIRSGNPSPDMLELLNRAGLDTRQALILATMKRPFRRIRTLLEEYLSRYTTQSFTKIDELFLSFGLKDFCQNVQGTTRKKRLKRSVELLVEHRHNIVHNGDVSDKGTMNRFNPLTVVRRCSDLMEFVDASDKFLLAWVKNGS